MSPALKLSIWLGNLPPSQPCSAYSPPPITNALTVVLETGSGKTRIAAEVILRQRERLWVPTNPLVEQV